MGNQSNLSKLNRVGNRLCLDFVNTSGWLESENPSEWLIDYGGLVEWGVLGGLITEEVGKTLAERAERFPDLARKTYDQAIRLRKSIFLIFRAVIKGIEVEQGDLSLLNDWLRRASKYERLTVTDNGRFSFVLQDEAEWDVVLWHVAKSAGDLLASTEISRVKQCEGDDCGWMFLDTSRNHSRRWCSMEDCGNRVKVKRHYQRHLAKGKE
ncbi:MAG TPA: CGNR zinc finger domain-containing protein [Bacillales bacterium]|nr:CGNR zinc finger domain-containing protein [Bacillales bacterium]